MTKYHKQIIDPLQFRARGTKPKAECTRFTLRTGDANQKPNVSIMEPTDKDKTNMVNDYKDLDNELAELQNRENILKEIFAQTTEREVRQLLGILCGYNTKTMDQMDKMRMGQRTAIEIKRWTVSRRRNPTTAPLTFNQIRTKNHGYTWTSKENEFPIQLQQASELGAYIV